MAKKKKVSQSNPLFKFAIPLLLGIIFVVLIALNQFSPSDRSRADQQNPDQFVQAVGSILTFQGKPMRLQGVNINNAPWNNNWKGSVTGVQAKEVDYQKLAELGGNHFRFGITYGMWKYDRNNFYQMMDQQISWGKKHGIWILPVAFTTPGDCSSSGWGDPCNMRNDTEKQTELIAMWKDIAARYKDEPVIVGYDLLNEPGYTYEWFFNWAQKARDEITAVDPNHLIFVTAGTDGKFPRKLNGSNIVYQVHDYVPMALSHCGDSNYGRPPLDSSWRYSYPGNAPDYDGTQVYWSKSAFNGQGHERANLLQRLSVNWAKSNDVPLYIGEWGGETCFQGLNTYISDHGELFSEWGINHAHFVWKNTQGRWGIYPNGDSLIPYDQSYLDAIKVSWNGAVKYQEMGQGDLITPTPTPTPVPSVSPTPTPAVSATPSPTPTSVVTSSESLQLSAPLTLGQTSVRPGETIQGRVTYKNTSTRPLTISRMVLASRGPGGTNENGPYFDFGPEGKNITLNPGQSYTLQASRTFSDRDPKGQWYAYSTYQLNGKWIDAPASSQVQFQVVDQPRLQTFNTSNRSITFQEVQPRTGNKIFLKVNYSGSKRISYINWHIWPGLTPKYVGTEEKAPYYLGGMNGDSSPKGYTLPSVPMRLNVWIKFSDGSSTSAYSEYK